MARMVRNDDLSIFRNDPDIQRALASLDKPTAIAGKLPPGLMIASAATLVGAASPREIAERLRDCAQAWEFIAHIGGYLTAPIARGRCRSRWNFRNGRQNRSKPCT